MASFSWLVVSAGSGLLPLRLAAARLSNWKCGQRENKVRPSQHQQRPSSELLVEIWGKKKKKGSKCYTHLPAFSFCRQGILARTKSSKDQNKLMKKKTIPCDKLEEATTVNSFHLIVMSSDEKNSRGNREVNRKSDASGLLLISRLILQSLVRSLHLQRAPKFRMLQYGKPTPVPY